MNRHEPPYPERIIDSTGSGFSFGVIGGTAFHFLKGIYNSPPKGGTRRLIISGTQAVITKVPPIGRRFAVWGATLSSLECAMIYARQKEDRWNSIIAGFTAGGLLGMRHGLRPAMGLSVCFAGLSALILGTNIMTVRFRAAPLQPVQIFDVPSSPPPGLFMGNKWKWTRS